MPGRLPPGQTIEPRLALTFRGSTVNSHFLHAQEHYTYLLATPHVVSIELIADIAAAPGTPARQIVLQRTVSTPWDQMEFDTTFPRYLLNPMPTDDLNAIFAARDTHRLTLTARITCRYMRFYELMLQQFVRSDNTLDTLATPTHSAAVLATVQRPSRRQIRHSMVNTQLTVLSVSLEDWDIDPSGFVPPYLLLRVYLQTRETLAPAPRDRVLLLFAASTFTTLYEASNRSGVTQSRFASAVDSNWIPFLSRYLMQYTDLRRAWRIRSRLRNIVIDSVDLGYSAAQILQDVRDEIDRALITANHWPENREMPNALEQHQLAISAVLGEMHGNHVLGTPITILLRMQREFALSLEDTVLFILAWGVGHCGEHAQVSFEIMSYALQTHQPSRQMFGNVVYSGRANVDHAFVMVGIVVRNVSETVPRTNNVPLLPSGSAQFFDLAAALGTGSGALLDPYLDPSAHPSVTLNLSTLLRYLTHGVSRHRRTSFVYYHMQFPAPDPIVTRVSSLANI